MCRSLETHFVLHLALYKIYIGKLIGASEILWKLHVFFEILLVLVRASRV